MSKKARSILGPLLLLTTVAVGFRYLMVHRELLRQLKHTPISTTLLVMVLYMAMFGALLLILGISIKICSKKIARQENSLLNAHSLLINFFIPGQSGPAYRGAYLHKRHKLKVKNYIAVTLLYYVFYAAVSICLLMLGAGLWRQLLLATVLSTAICALVITKYPKYSKLRNKGLALSRSNVSILVAVTALQAVIQIAIYAVELRSVNHNISFGQVIAYTGAANLALFAAFTPGAIGIRESFLIFSEKLHHINSANIVVANVIDRSIYLAFLLGILAIMVFVHAKGKINFRKLPLLVRQSFNLSYLYKS